MINKILILTDFSENANHALNFALELAKRANSEVLIHHTCDYPAANDQGVEQNERAIEKLQQLLGRINNDSQNSNLVLRINSRIGSLAENTDRLVKDENIDLIIMGTRDTSRLDQAMFGSSVMAILDAIKCPTFVIPETASLHPLRRIAYASDNQLIEDGKVLMPLKDIATIYGSEVVFVHVREYDQKVTKEEIIERSKEESMLGNEIRYNFNEVYNEDPIAGLDTYISSYDDINSMAVLKRKPQVEGCVFSRTNTSSLIHGTTIPLLVLQEDTDVS